MSEVRIAAEPRTEFGKGAARRVRRAGRVPAVLYGHGTEPRHISLPGHELMLALKSANVLLTLDIEGKKELALPKDVQRDPIRGVLEHVDLILVKRGEKVKVDVALHLVGEVAPGGLVVSDLNALEIEAEATNIPGGIDFSIEGLEIGASVQAKDIALPAGTVLVTDPEHPVLHVSAAPTQEQLEAELGEVAPAEEAEAAEAVAEGGAPAEGEPPAETESTEG